MRPFKDFSARQLCKKCAQKHSKVRKSGAEGASSPDPRRQPASGADILKLEPSLQAGRSFHLRSHSLTSQPGVSMFCGAARSELPAPACSTADSHVVQHTASLSGRGCSYPTVETAASLSLTAVLGSAGAIAARRRQPSTLRRVELNSPWPGRLPQHVTNMCKHRTQRTRNDCTAFLGNGERAALTILSPVHETDVCWEVPREPSEQLAAELAQSLPISRN